MAEPNMENIIKIDELIDIIPFGFYIVKDSTIINCNNSILNIFGYKAKKELLGLKSSVLYPETQKDGGISLVKGKNIISDARSLNKKSVEFEWLYKRKNGELFIADIELYIENDYVMVFILNIRDEEIINDINNQIQDLQQKDSLTKLYNRNYFIEVAKNLLNDCDKEIEKYSIILISLERFKNINDSTSHLIGDKLLIELSERLQDLMDEEYILSRFSGDEFVILFKFYRESEINEFTKLILNTINKPFVIEKNIIHVNARIGISKFPDDSEDLENLIKFADIAMLNSKTGGKGKICFYEKEMSKEIEINFQITNYLTQAISNNELNVHYQPIYDLHNENALVGAEALLRWQNPILGYIPPYKFISLAEKTGHIYPIGEWVLNQICKQISLWKNKYYVVPPIAINISVKQLEESDFHKMVKAILIKYNINPSNIEIEITESISSGDILNIVKNLKELKRIGIKISMDDFGTGFSSLGQLDLFELDKLKIDKVFINDLVSVPKRQGLVKSIISMAKSLDLMVIAEGVETHEQLLYLTEYGCHYGQGYLFSKPLPAEDFEKFLLQFSN